VLSGWLLAKQFHCGNILSDYLICPLKKKKTEREEKIIPLGFASNTDLSQK